MVVVLLAARPALAGWLEGETSFCDLLGLTLAGVLGGWVILYGTAKRAEVPAESGLAVLAVPTLHLSVVILFPAPEHLMLVAPAVPLLVAAALRVWFGRRSRA